MPNSPLRELIFSLPIVDCHTHMRQWSEIPQPMDAYTLFNHSGIIRSSWASAGLFSTADYRKFITFMNWPSLSAALEPIKSMAFWRILMSGLKSLYDIDFGELDEESLNALSEKMAAAYKDPKWYPNVLREKSRLEVICQDSRAAMDRSLFSPVWRFDNLVWFGKSGYREKVMEKFGTDRTVTVEGLVGCLRQEFAEALADGAVAIKNNNTWARALDYQEVSEDAAANALAECEVTGCSDKSVKILCDFVMDRIAKLCAEHDIPLQLHTGPAMGLYHYIDYGNPLHLNNFILRNLDTKIILFHAGGPFTRECCWLAQQFPNVYLDLCWVLGPQYMRNALDEWIELVPQTKLMWGTDVNHVEEAYAMSQYFRNTLCNLLEDRVKSGYMTWAAAERFAKAITSENAKSVLRL